MTCTTPNCDGIHYAKGTCKRCYMAAWHRSKQAQAYEQTRRNDEQRREQERKRNRRRRSDINAWLRGRQLGTPILEAVRSDVVFARDGYRCCICGRKTSGKWPKLSAPTIDHIVPLSKGGEHSYRNVQTACFGCNVHKRNGSANDQLRLVG